MVRILYENGPKVPFFLTEIIRAGCGIGLDLRRDVDRSPCQKKRRSVFF
jgi:hypothetical protein